jgi:hypothetical protein
MHKKSSQRRNAKRPLQEARIVLRDLRKLEHAMGLEGKDENLTDPIFTLNSLALQNYNRCMVYTLQFPQNSRCSGPAMIAPFDVFEEDAAGPMWIGEAHS